MYVVKTGLEVADAVFAIDVGSGTDGGILNDHIRKGNAFVGVFVLHRASNFASLGGHKQRKEEEERETTCAHREATKAFPACRDVHNDIRKSNS